MYNNCFPRKKVKLRIVILNKQGITKGLLKSVRKKNIILACVSSETHNLQAAFFFVFSTLMGVPSMFYEESLRKINAT